jgi:hypothetical protein
LHADLSVVIRISDLTPTLRDCAMRASKQHDELPPPHVSGQDGR